MKNTSIAAFIILFVFTIAGCSPDQVEKHIAKKHPMHDKDKASL